VTYQVQEVSGLQYIPNYIPEHEHQDLLATIDQQPWLTDLKRRVQHYGYRYDYKSRVVHSTSFLGPLPGWVVPMAERLHRDNLIEIVPDQVIVNEYHPGQGIASHVDCIPCFGDTIISLSLGSPCVMIYTRIRDSREVPILLEPRSLVVMQSESRHQWKHGILKQKNDVYNRQIIKRGRRVSITFRKVIV